MQRWNFPTRLQALPRRRRRLFSSAHLQHALAVAMTPRYHHPESLLHQEQATAEEFIQGTQPESSRMASTRNEMLAASKLARELLALPYGTDRAREFKDVVDGMLQIPEALLNATLCGDLASCSAYHLNPTRVRKVVLLGSILPESQYEFIVSQFVAACRWTDALKVQQAIESRLKSQGLPLHVIRVRIQAALGKEKELRSALEDFEDANITPPRSVFNMLIRASLEAQDIKWAEKVLLTMCRMGLAYDASTFTSILAGYRSLGPNAEVESRIYEVLKSVGLLKDHYVVNALMQMRIDAGDTEGSRTLLALMKYQEANVPSPEELYGAQQLFDSSGYAAPSEVDPFPPLSTFRISTRISSSNPPSIATDELGIVTLNIFLNQCAKTADISLATQIYNQILNSYHQPTEHTYAAVIRVLTCPSRPDNTEKGLIDAIRFAAAALCGNSDQARAFCEHLGVNTLEHPEESTTSVEGFSLPQNPLTRPTAHIFNALLHAILRIEHAGEPHQGIVVGLLRMEILLREMKSLRVEPDVNTARIFLSHLKLNARLGHDRMEQITQDLFGMSLGEVIGEEQHTNASAHKGSVGMDDRILDHSLDSSENSPAFRQAGIPLPLFQSGSTKSLSSNSEETHSQPTPSPRQAQAFFDHLVARRIVPKAQHYLALMRAYANSGEVSSALQVLSAAIAAGIITTIAMATVLIVGYAKLGKPELSEEVFLQMQRAGGVGGGSGIKPDAASVDALARAYISAGRLSDARRVILEHWHSVDRSYHVRPDQARFVAQLESLSLKALLYALAHLPGAQRKGGSKGKTFNKVQRRATMTLVRRVVKTWKGEKPSGRRPTPPRLSPTSISTTSASS